jgi:hypothetical protein
MSPMAESFYLREQAERCRRLARGSNLACDSLLRLAEEYAAGAVAEENDDPPAWQAGPDDDGAS